MTDNDPQYSLTVIDAYGKVITAPLERFPFTIGRAKGNELVVVDPSISRRHASIQLTDSGLIIVDRESRNGILVNGKEITEPHRIQPGDLLELGSVKLQLERVQAPAIPQKTSRYEKVQYYPSPPREPPARQEGAQRPPPSKDSLDWQTVLRLFTHAPLPAVYEHILDLIEERVPFDRCFLIRFENGGPDRITIIARRVHRGPEAGAIVSKDILRRVAQSQESVVVTADDTEFSPTESFVRTRANVAMCIPLTVEGTVTGVVYIDRRSHTAAGYREALEALAPLAGLVALKIENVRLLEEHITAQVIERDLQLAKEIIDKVMPQEPLCLPGYMIEGYTEPCYEVGGDYFDFFRTGGEDVTLAIGDVSGKGLPSAFYVAGVRAVLHADIEDRLEIDRVMARMERHVRSTFRTDHFITIFIATLNLERGVLTYCNAGHVPPICLRAGGQVLELAAPDPALNIVSWEKYQCHELHLRPGDILLLYTDGLTEAEDAGGRQFGVDRLVGSLARHRDAVLNTLQERILTEVTAFTGGRAPADDRTLILVKRAP